MPFSAWIRDELPLLVGAAGIGVFAGWSLARKRAAAGLASRGAADPTLLPDPALRWLVRSHGALGAWICEGADEQDGQARWQRVTDDGKLTNTELEAIERRLTVAREQSATGAERMDRGTLLFGTASGLGAGILLPDRSDRAALQSASDDLVLLLEGLARRPIIARITREQEPAVESVGSIGLRLAYQLERILNAEVLVGVNEHGAVKVVGVSGRADRRLLDTFAVPGSPLFQVGRGDIPSLTSIADPLGGVVQDRRSRFTPAIMLPIKNGEDPVGAVAFWTDDEAEPIGPVIAEVQEAMRNAGPRIFRALEMDRYKEAANVDPLTGLKNRRGLEEVMARIGAQPGAMVYADLDKFKTLNDTLGHPAGDAALVHFARLVHEQIRGGDTAARIGGEEFAIWLPTTTLAYAVRIADRIRIKLGTTQWDWQGRPWPLGASFGVAAMPETCRSIQNLAAQADAALMVAKKEGRNRVEAARRVE
ncbi:MAG: GGDEF domain-containing protein [Gemmatimonadota bacterium]